MPPDSITVPICPLFSLQDPCYQDCLQERCAWWIETKSTGHCAMFWMGLQALSQAMHKNGE